MPLQQQKDKCVKPELYFSGEQSVGNCICTDRVWAEQREIHSQEDLP